MISASQFRQGNSEGTCVRVFVCVCAGGGGLYLTGYISVGDTNYL